MNSMSFHIIEDRDQIRNKGCLLTVDGITTEMASPWRLASIGIPKISCRLLRMWKRSSTTTACLPPDSARISRTWPVTDCPAWNRITARSWWNDNHIKLTLNGEVAKSQDPATHFSIDFVTTNRQVVHLESLPSREFTALAPSVSIQGMKARLSIFPLWSRLSAPNLNEPGFH